MTPSLFSVSYAGMWGRSAVTLAEFIARAGSLQFPSVMLAGKRPHLSPLDASPDYLRNLKRSLEEARESDRCARFRDVRSA